MAERRMFAKTIVLSDAFLDMGLGSRCLYMTLSMLADDDGFINNPKSIMRQCGATEDDLKVLILKKFIIPFESGIVVIKHWRINNYLRSDRYVATKYTDEKAELTVDERGVYSRSIESGIPTGIPSMGKPSIGKDSIGKDSIKQERHPDVKEVAEYVKEMGYHFDAESFVAFYESKGWKVGNQPMKSWKACCVTWEKRRKDDKPKNAFHNYDERSDDSTYSSKAIMDDFAKFMNPPEGESYD